MHSAPPPETSTDDAAADAAPPVEGEAAPDPLAEAHKQAADFKDKLMRTAADFDNYRKRSRREVSDAEKKGRDGLLKDLLPVFDNLERATTHAGTAGEGSEPSDIKGLVDGITLVMKQFHDALGRLGIQRIESVGKAFDPGLHEAIQHLETDEFDPGCVAAEVQPGYLHGDRLLRPALVVVAKRKVTAEPNPEDTAGDSGAADGASEPAGH